MLMFKIFFGPDFGYKNLYHFRLSITKLKRTVNPDSPHKKQ